MNEKLFEQKKIKLTGGTKYPNFACFDIYYYTATEFIFKSQQVNDCSYRKN